MNLIAANLRVAVETDGPSVVADAAAVLLGLGREDIKIIKVLAKALDFSDTEQFYYVYSAAVSVPDTYPNILKLSLYSPAVNTEPLRKTLGSRPIIIGFGPAGMFAAIELVRRGLKPLIFERGRKIEERSADVRYFVEQRVLDPESNIQFGEGGAGAYSDGKLFARANNSIYGNMVLETFIRFGAPHEIAYTAKPHVGTDVLCKIVRNIRHYLLEQGAEIHYCSKMTDLIVSGGKAAGVVINGREEYLSEHIYLAVGHSARDVFELLHKRGANLEPRGISIGVRIEHPVETINLIRYGQKYKSFSALGAATYSFNYTDRQAGRGVYTFCMCPGGEIVNASSENGLLVVNGMSFAARASAFSNAALAVICHAADYKAEGPLAGIEFQKGIESRAFRAGGGDWRVPAQNLTDFLSGKMSERLNENSCRTGVSPADMREIFPDFVTATLFAAFAQWKKEYPLFVSDQAVLLAPETRTSCPVKIPRGENCEALYIKHLYPIGEGAGYAGGITSSAIDAIKAVEYSLSAV